GGKFMNIAVIGIGSVGGTLARRLSAKGHNILLGAKDPNSSEAAGKAKQIPNATIHSVKEAVAKSEVILLATPWNVTEDVVKSIANLSKAKVLIDCTNPLKPDLSGLELGHSTSGAEKVQMWAPQALVYKAFNTTGANIMADPFLESRKSVM